MKTTRTFRGSWFVCAVALAIAVGEFAFWEISKLHDLRLNPVTVAFLCAGLVAATTAVLFEDAEVK